MLENRFPIAILLALFVFLAPAFCVAQGNVVIVEYVQASSLSGTVKMKFGDAMPGVKVISFDCGPGEFRGKIDPKPWQTTHTDANGRFSLSWRFKTTICIQFASPGFDLLQIQVTRSKSAGELHPELSVGT
jgi:hypothetical protein